MSNNAATHTAEPGLEDSFGKLTERESEILRKAGERIFELSGRLAESERQLTQMRQESAQLRELLTETRSSRDALSAHVASLQRHLDREYDERAELRRLLAGLQMQLQAMLPGTAQNTPGGAQVIGRQAGQRSASVQTQTPVQAQVEAPRPARRRPQKNGWLQNAARGLRALRGG
jgi:chromosome segregation ATPase